MTETVMVIRFNFSYWIRTERDGMKGRGCRWLKGCINICFNQMKSKILKPWEVASHYHSFCWHWKYSFLALLRKKARLIASSKHMLWKWNWRNCLQSRKYAPKLYYISETSLKYSKISSEPVGILLRYVGRMREREGGRKIDRKRDWERD